MSDSEEGQVMDSSSWERSDGEVTPDSRHSPAASPASQLSDASNHRAGSPVSSRHLPSQSRSRSRSPSHFRSHGSLSRSMSGSEKHQSYSRSRSRTPPKYERSRSISPPYRRRRDQVDGVRRNGAWSRSRSRSPVYRSRGGRGGPRRGGGNGYARGGQFFNRENPEPSRCLGVFGLGLYTQERDLREVFGRYGPIEDIQVVYDRQTRRSRGFGFIYYRSTDDAIDAREACNGLEVDGRRIRVDFSITDRPHSPTPGIYLGKPTSERYRGQRNNSSPYYPRRRSPSPYYGRRSRSPHNNRRRSHSRSHSWSPRRF